MFKRAIRRVKTYSQAREYQQIFWGKFNLVVPATYFLNSKSYLLYKNGLPIGGYMIVPRKLSRTYKQIPFTAEGLEAIDILNGRRFAELTGYFIDERKEGFYLVTHWLFNVLFSKNDVFIYSYRSKNASLRKYYSFGDPLLLYKGIVRDIDGMNATHDERIELITKLGFCKLFLRRLLKNKSKR